MNQLVDIQLSDGNKYSGTLIGSPVKASGELVFTTGMVGYSEAMTDPSYYGQILVFGYPMIGNYGVKKQLSDLQQGFESSKVHASAFIFSEVFDRCYHWSNDLDLPSWLQQQDVAAIVGVDTRDLICRIRNTGRLYARVEIPDATASRCWEESGFYDPANQNIMDEVSTGEIKKYGEGPIKIGVIDCGVKWNILRQLIGENRTVYLLPHDHPLDIDVDGWVISNGPGDPEKTGDLIERVQSLLTDDRPILGICLGHQVLSLAAGAKTKRMAYGHRSHNQPVRLIGGNTGYMSSQNHGFVVSDLPDSWSPWFSNVNDQSIEGVRHCEKPFWGVQFHPEAAGGPRDTAWIIEDFLEQVNACKK